MNLTKQEFQKLSVVDIDNLINQLEEGADSLLWFQSDKRKYYNLQNIIGLLIDLRCEKIGIQIP
jgi:hypothetical protein